MALSPSLSEDAATAAQAAARDHLLLAAWRKIVIGETNCPVLALELGAACGGGAAATHGAILAFVTALAYAGRRRLRVGTPGCPGMTRDERQLLDLVAAAQDGAETAVEAHLRWLTRPDLRAAVIVATAALAAVLTAQHLTVRQPQAPARPDGGYALCLCSAATPGDVVVAGTMI